MLIHGLLLLSHYCHALYKAVVFIGKLPDDFTQEEVDSYFSSMLNRQPIPAEAQFKHFVYGLKNYRKTIGCSELQELALPAIRREKKLPRILSVEQVRLLLKTSGLYSKTLFAVVYDCGPRAFEACNLKWNDISLDRHQVHIKKGKGGKDRIVPISEKTLKVLNVYRKKYPSKNLVFKAFGNNENIDPNFIRHSLREVLKMAGLYTSLSTHSFRHSYATHLMKAGENSQTVQQYLGHKSVSTQQ